LAVQGKLAALKEIGRTKTGIELEREMNGDAGLE